MKAIMIRKPGGPEVLSYEDVPTPTTKPGWSLIKVFGFGINRSEIFTRNGWSPSVKFPRILGIEGVGEIAETTDAERLPVGTKVVAMMNGLGREFDGSYAQYMLVPNKQIYLIHSQLSWPEIAAIPETGFTAFGSLTYLKLSKADTLLIRGATSGVGVMAMKLARAMVPSLEITGTTRKPEKRQRLQDAGFDKVLIDQNGELPKDRHFTKILDLIGPTTTKDSMKLMVEGGILCMTGELGGKWNMDSFNAIDDMPSGAYLTGFSSDSITQAKLDALFNLIETNHLNVKPTKVFDLAHTADAQAFLDSSTSFGKVVVINQ